MSEHLERLESMLELVAAQQQEIEDIDRLPKFVSTTEVEVRSLTENVGSLTQNMQSLTENVGSLIEGMGSQAQNVRSLTENMGSQAQNVRSLISNLDSMAEAVQLLHEQVRSVVDISNENQRRFEILRAEAVADRQRTEERFDQMLLEIQKLRLER